MSTSWRRLRQGRVSPRLQMSCCSLESNITWIQVACLLLDWSSCWRLPWQHVPQPQGGRMAIQGCRELELDHSTFSGRSASQPADQELRPDTPVCNQVQGPVITVCSHSTSSAPPRPPPVIFANICHIYTFSFNPLLNQVNFPHLLSFVFGPHVTRLL